MWSLAKMLGGSPTTPKQPQRDAAYYRDLEDDTVALAKRNGFMSGVLFACQNSQLLSMPFIEAEIERRYPRPARFNED
jgi:hypothetical protein